jgi:hypothetical protein
MLNKQKAVDIP